MSTRRTSGRNAPFIAAGPKRRIERIFSKGSVAGNATVQNVALHTAEDAKTLVALRGRLNFVSTRTAAAANVFVDWQVAINPAGTPVVSPSSGGVSDTVAPMQLIAFGRLQIYENTGVESMDFTEVVSKAMRKMKENDVLAFRYLMSSAVGNLVYTWDAHFKE